MHEESSTRRKVDDKVHEGAIPAYLLDRETTTRAKVKECGLNLWTGIWRKLIHFGVVHKI